MIDIPLSDDYHKNYDRTLAKGQDYEHCLVCGRAVNTTKSHWRGYVHGGGAVMVTADEYEQMNHTDPGAALGTYPVGPECLKAHPELRPYVIRQKG